MPLKATLLPTRGHQHLQHPDYQPAVHLRKSSCVLDPEGTLGKAGLEAGVGVLGFGRAGHRGRGTEQLYSGFSFKASCRENKQSLCACSWQWQGQGCPSLRIYLKSAHYTVLPTGKMHTLW